AGKHISKQPEAQRNRTESNRDEFQKSDREENHDHQILNESTALALRPKEVQRETPDAVGTQRPNEPQHHKNRRHGEGHIQIGIAAAQKRMLNMEAVWFLLAPPDRADTRDQPEPICE